MNIHKTIGELTLSGKLTRTADGGFTLNLTGTPQGTPVDPPPIDPIPSDAVIIEPSGGDDTQLLRNTIDNLYDGDTLLLKGMFHVSDTISTSGGRYRTVAAYPGVRSGILVESADMPGVYGAMLQFNGAVGSKIQGLEIDAQGHSTMPIEVNGGEDNTIEGCYIHDIGYSGSDDPTLAAIHSEGGTRLTVRGNRIERTGGDPNNDSGIRGIWLGKGQVDVTVEDNIVSDTGHTCIAVEPCSGVIRGNHASNSLTQGTLYKIIRHPEAAYAGKVEFYDNIGEHSRHAGLMLEAADFEEVAVYRNRFLNCGEQGSTFGFFYTSQWTTKNARVHDNMIENCRSFGAMNRAENCIFENNTISGDDTLWLENDCSNITVNNSGRVEIGSNCSNIWVDGQQIA